MRFGYSLSFLLLIAVVTLADDIDNKTAEVKPAAGPEPPAQTTEEHKKKTTTDKPLSTTVKNITTAATTTSAPITTPVTNATTPPPATNTTTPAPVTPPATNTTTPAPVTTPATNTTTPAPVTTPATNTTTHAPITTPSPTPKPADEWIVKDKNNTVCIIANMLIKITVPFKSVENKTVNGEFKLENVHNATATGECGVKEQTLTLTWKNITSTFKFSHKDNSSYFLSSIEVTIPVNNQTFPNNTMVNASKITFKHDAQVFTVPMNRSYTCTSEKPVTLAGSVFNATGPLNVNVSGTLTVSKVHVEAFGHHADAKYSAPMDCATVETPDIVPIVVGLVLAGLVVVVLIAYLVGRRRAQARGYLSM